MANPIKSLVGQTAIYGVSSIVGRFINYFLVTFYTNVFKTHEFGVVTELIAYVTIFVVLLTYGMETSFFRFCQNEDYTRKRIYSTAIGSLTISSLLFIVLVFVFGNTVAYRIGYQSNPEYVILLGLTVTLDAFASIPFAKLRIENKAKRFAMLKLANIMISIFLNITFLFIIPKLFGVHNFVYRLLYSDVSVGYIFIAYFLTSIITLFLLYPELKEGYSDFAMDFKLLKKMLIYGFPILLAGLAGMFNESFDRILMKYLVVVPHEIIAGLGLKLQNLEASKYVMGQLGIYGANVRVAVIMSLFLQAFRYAAEPFFFNYSKKEDSRLLYAKVMKYYIFCSLLLFLGVTLFTDLIKYLVGPSYREGLIVVPLLMMSKIFFGIVFNLSIWYKLKNMTKYGAYVAYIGTAFSLLLNCILIPIYGYIGAAWASVISYFIMMVVSFIFEKRNFAIPYDYSSIAVLFSIALVFYFIGKYDRFFTEYYIFLNFLLIFAFIYIFIKKEKINVKSMILVLKKK